MRHEVSTTLEHISNHFGIQDTLALFHNGALKRYPIEIPGVGRDDLAKLFKTCGFKVGAEIGVEQGGYAEVLCKRNPDARLYCVDAWAAYDGYREHVTQSKLDGFYEATVARLEPYRATFVRDYSVDAATTFEDGSLDFVYIDANHELFHVMEDLRAWIPKVRKGGIISGHDYCQRTESRYQVAVVEAVQAYTSAYFIRPWFVLGRKEVRQGEERDRPRSFMWVKS